jgi:O-antigen ligase
VSVTRSSVGPRPRLLIVSLAAIATLIGAGSGSSPRVVLAGSLGLLFVAITLRNLTAGLTMFTVLIFLERIPSISSAGLTFTKLAGAVLAIAWLLAVLKRDSAIPSLSNRHPAVAYSALGLLFWTIASMLWASDPGAARTTALRFAQGVLLLFVVFAAIRERRHLSWILYAFLVGASLSAFVGLSGVTHADRADIYASGRLTGGIGDPNELAAVLVPALSFALFMFVIKRGTIVRLLLLASAFICALALFRTESRGGLIGLAVMLVASLLVAGPIRARATLIALATTGFALAYFTLLAPPQALARVTTFSGSGDTGRADLWTVALDVTRDHPIFGVGAGNFQVVEPTYAFRNRNLPRFDLIVDTPKVVHNMYLQILAELGVVGFILFAVLIVGAFVVAFRACHAFAQAGDLEMEILARGIIIGTIGMLTAFVFLSAQYEKQLPLLLGVLAALTTLARIRPTREAPRTTLQPAPAEIGADLAYFPVTRRFRSIPPSRRNSWP